jgi:muramidase (phage lysozyme)
MDRVAKAAPLLALIRRHESDSAVKPQGAASVYDVVWGGIKAKDRPKQLSAMTVGKVLWWQDLIDSRYMSEAAGAYQIMEDTLRTLKVSRDAIFDKATQDALCLQLLDRRGWDDCEAGRISPEAFGNELAKEWASLPVLTGPKKGRSYYAGDGLNKAHATVAEVLTAIAGARSGEHGVPPGPPASAEDDTVAWLRRVPVAYREVGEWLAEGKI